MRNSPPSLFQICLLSVFLIVGVLGNTNNSSTVAPERYELCTNQACIAALQQEFNLIQVSSTPSKAAMQPGWPETLISIVTSTFALVQVAILKDKGRQPSLGKLIFTAIVPILVSIAWASSFGFIQHDKATGGWISVLDWTLTVLLTVWATEVQLPLVAWIFAIFGIFQLAGSIAVIAQRWKGEIGTIAYQITNSNGCTPAAGFRYLEQGARSRNFRIIQTTELVYSFSVIVTAINVVTNLTRRFNSRREVQTYSYSKAAAAFALLLMYIPVIVYEAVIANKGAPVVISGDCMLIELDPRFGFLDSEIETWWKVLVGFGGL